MSVEIDISAVYAPSEKQNLFHASDAKYRLLLGAWGSGKTTMLVYEDILQAIEYPGSLGVIYRKTYPALRDTTKRDYLRALPPELRAAGREVKSEGREEFAYPNGSRTLFRCLDDALKLGSTVFDRVGIDEAWEVQEEEFRTLAYGRLRGEIGPRRLVAVTNPPNIDHWLYRWFVAEAEPDTATFHFSTYDNAANLPEGYITKLEAMPLAWRRKFLLGTWGFLGKGKPVFECFREDWHVAALTPIRSRPIYRGWDFGFARPACVWLQVDAMGHAGVLHERLGQDQSLQSFANGVLADSDRLFRGYKFEDFCDVAGTQKNDRGPTAVQILRNDFGLTPQFRKMGVWQSVERVTKLLSTAPDGTHLLRLNTTCTVLREALAGGYEMDTRSDQPKKDGYYDNIVDAMKYALIPATTPARAAFEGQRLPRLWRVA